MAFCECGSFILHDKNIKRHLLTQKHKQLIQLKNKTQVKKVNLKDVAASTLQAYLRAKIDANDLQPAIFSDLFIPI
jgi:ribosomal protein L35